MRLKIVIFFSSLNSPIKIKVGGHADDVHRLENHQISYPLSSLGKFGSQM